MNDEEFDELAERLIPNATPEDVRRMVDHARSLRRVLHVAWGHHIAADDCGCNGAIGDLLNGVEDDGH